MRCAWACLNLLVSVSFRWWWGVRRECRTSDVPGAWVFSAVQWFITFLIVSFCYFFQKWIDKSDINKLIASHGQFLTIKTYLSAIQRLGTREVCVCGYSRPTHEHTRGKWWEMVPFFFFSFLFILLFFFSSFYIFFLFFFLFFYSLLSNFFSSRVVLIPMLYKKNRVFDLSKPCSTYLGIIMNFFFR